jgi:hypothetical protein
MLVSPEAADAVVTAAAVRFGEEMVPVGRARARAVKDSDR